MKKEQEIISNAKESIEFPQDIILDIMLKLERHDLASVFRVAKYFNFLKTKPRIQQELNLTKKLLGLAHLLNDEKANTKSFFQLKEQAIAFGQAIEDENIRSLFFDLLEKEEDKIPKNENTVLLLKKSFAPKGAAEFTISSLNLLMIARVFKYKSLLNYAWDERSKTEDTSQVEIAKKINLAITCGKPIYELLAKMRITKTLAESTKYPIYVTNSLKMAVVCRNYTALQTIYSFLDMQLYQISCTTNLTAKESAIKNGIQYSSARNDIVAASIALFTKDIDIEGKNLKEIKEQLSLEQLYQLLEASYKSDFKSMRFSFLIIKQGVIASIKASNKNQIIKFKVNLEKLFSITFWYTTDERIVSNYELIGEILNFLNKNKKYIEFSNVREPLWNLLHSQLYLEEFLNIFDHEIMISENDSFGFEFIQSALLKPYSNSNDFFESTLKFVRLAKAQGCNALREKIEEAINWVFKQYGYLLDKQTKNIKVILYSRENKEQLKEKIISNCAKHKKNDALNLLNRIQFYDFYQQICEFNPSEDANKFFALLKQTIVDFVSHATHEISEKLKNQNVVVGFFKAKKIPMLKDFRNNFEELITSFDFNQNAMSLHQACLNFAKGSEAFSEITAEIYQLYFFIKSIEPEIKKYFQIPSNVNEQENSQDNKVLNLGWAQTH